MNSVKNLALLRLICLFVLFIFDLLSFGESMKVILKYKCQWSNVKDMPEIVDLKVMSSKVSTELHLSRVSHIQNDLPVLTLSVDDYGMIVHTKANLDNLQMIAFYQDLEHNAAMQVTRYDDTSKPGQHLTFMGQFVMDGIQYTLEKAFAARSPTSSFDQYVLKYPLNIKKTDNNRIRPDHDVKVIRSNRQHLSHSSTQSDGDRRDKHRRPRQASTDYSIDTVVIVDYKAYLRFYHNAGGNRSLALLNIKEYYSFIISGLDMLYQDIKHADFRIRVYLMKIIVAETKESSNFTEQYQVPDTPLNTVDNDDALDALREYVVGPGSVAVFPSDHVMLFTGYDLTSQELNGVSKANAGRAYESNLCDENGYSTSVVEDTMGLNSVHIAAHELGHVLSAKHDGYGNSCDSSARYIMATTLIPATNTTELNPWRFSECSEKYIIDYITSLSNTSAGKKCLLERLQAEDHLNKSDQNLPGLKYSPDNQCKMIYGNLSYLCPGIKSYDLFIESAKICTQMFCYDPVRDSCYNTLPAQGTVCGNGKVCMMGECVTHPLAPVLNETCMFGDDQRYNFNNKSCSQIVSDSPYYCFEDEDVATYCCASCQAINKSNPDLCGKDNPNMNLNGMRCPEAIRFASYFCYNAQIQKHCCESCRAVRTHLPGCEYGDQVGNCKKADCKNDLEYLKDCCGTCSVQENSEVTTESSGSSSVTSALTGKLASEVAMEATTAASTTTAPGTSSDLKESVPHLTAQQGHTTHVNTLIPDATTQAPASTTLSNSLKSVQWATSTVKTTLQGNAGPTLWNHKTTTSPPSKANAQLRQYLFQQKQQTQHHLLKQQQTMERLLHHDLLHQEYTLPHHQALLKHLLRHYFQHQKNLLDQYLSQQRALLEEHLRNHVLLETLCKG
ncbi:A disintegrin and metalloproteinase with thrombospondin motifs 7-like isoform X2 [Biomphalaria glabrata]|uniref:A disintegrin and metalloproteinase with thrombospondin motifs 7-like isoform X2 n=1 Tax=Biomphalaria glabrata TaxID=6526 RepID=A0A9W2YJ50_BIOGL|nr:A disintegrin and metalloproteinase with thrombospondin motifs 7-like isoform X2 [Biomphalaria glabrata]